MDAALWAGAGTLPQGPPLADALPPETIPSWPAASARTACWRKSTRTDFAFAKDPADAPFFNRRARRSTAAEPARHRAAGRPVCIRKRVRGLRLGARLWGDRPVPARDWVHRGLWASLGLYLYTEAAALLRLRDLPFVSRLRRIDFAENALYVDCIQGENLRNQVALAGAAVHDETSSAIRRSPGSPRTSSSAARCSCSMRPGEATSAGRSPGWPGRSPRAELRRWT